MKLFRVYIQFNKGGVQAASEFSVLADDARGAVALVRSRAPALTRHRWTVTAAEAR